MNNGVYSKEARRTRRLKMERKEPVLVTQIGNYDMSALSTFTITAVGSVFILTRNNQCAKIKMYDDILHIISLNKCGYRGTITLKRIIAFANRNGFTIELEDASMLDEIDLALFKIAQTGNTWYAKHGFRNALDLHQDRILEFLQTPEEDGTIQSKAIEYGERLKQGDTTVVDKIKEICDKVERFLNGIDYSFHRKGGTRRR